MIRVGARLVVTTAATLAAALVLGACTHYTSPGDRLRKSVMEYNHAVRWQYWKKAAAYLPPDRRSDFVARKEAQQDAIRITEYEIRDVQHDGAAEPPEAKILVDFVWHRYPSLTVRHTRVRQTWKMIADAWLLEGQEEVELEPAPTTAEEMF